MLLKFWKHLPELVGDLPSMCMGILPPYSTKLASGFIDRINFVVVMLYVEVAHH